jgi:hypothetical protein
MNTLLVVLGLAVAIGAAARSTWSPCGLSMLSSITPLAERGRGHRYRTTVAWFITGALAGGCALGVLGALFAVGVRSLGPSLDVVLAIGAAASLVAFTSDLELFGFRLPIHHRQVNERWLDQFRPWVYGVGFGFQIGMGLATYIMTAALYLLLVVSALTQSVALCLILGAVFGLVRGLAVLLGRNIKDPESLRSFHRRFSAIGPKIRLLTVAIESSCAVAFVMALWESDLLAILAGAVVGTAIYLTKAGGLLRGGVASTDSVRPDPIPTSTAGGA